MSEVISIEVYLRAKLADTRIRMQQYLVQARELIDAAVERKSFNLLADARRFADLAVTESDKIKTIEKFLHIESPRVHVDKAL